jgi:CHRD domain
VGLRIAKLAALAVLAALAGALVVGGPVGAKNNSRHGKSKVLKANLKGAAEVPGPGDPDGRGKALIRVNPRKGKVCFRLRWKNIQEPNRAHIHEGRKGVAGDIVVTLFEGTPTRRGCVEGLDADLLRDIKRHPRRYYVNIHNAEFPAGAIRGQLKKSGRHRGGFRR